MDITGRPENLKTPLSRFMIAPGKLLLYYLLTLHYLFEAKRMQMPGGAVGATIFLLIFYQTGYSLEI
jgi:hypothetical protein